MVGFTARTCFRDTSVSLPDRSPTYSGRAALVVLLQVVPSKYRESCNGMRILQSASTLACDRSRWRSFAIIRRLLLYVPSRSGNGPVGYITGSFLKLGAPFIMIALLLDLLVYMFARQGNVLYHISFETMLLLFSFLIFIPAIYSQDVTLSCVNPAEHPNWATPPPRRRIDPYACAYAILGLERRFQKAKVPNFTFYSNASNPVQTPQDAPWALPNYAQSGMSLAFHSFIPLSFLFYDKSNQFRHTKLTFSCLKSSPP